METDVKRPAASGRIILLLLCVCAAARVMVFSAAYPFFSVVDEQAHFELVTRYAQAAPPRTLPHTSEMAMPYCVYFSSQEYMHPLDSPPIGGFHPPWKLPPEVLKTWMVPAAHFWRDVFINHEASQPPFYYTLGGIWWHLGQILGFRDLSLLLWLRCLNALFLVGVVILAGVIATKVFPENRFMQVAVPALTAFFPQSIFYAINNDALSPLVFGAAFLLLLKFYEAERPGLGLAAATGLLLAATFLTKISNLPLLAVAGLFLLLKAASLWRQGKLRGALSSFTALLLCAAVPMAAWMAWCRSNFGDLTGSSQKIKFLNWADKPVGQWLHHPLFTLSGFWYFLKTNLATFWQGEQLWHRQPLANPAIDSTYAILTLGILALTLAALARPRSGFTTLQRRTLAFGFLCCVAMLAFFALLSVKYDFQDCFYPSQGLPFFVSGRLMLGMLIPFLVVFAAGLDRFMSTFQPATKYFVLGVLLCFMLGCEIMTNLPVFSSEYNWLHL